MRNGSVGECSSSMPFRNQQDVQDDRMIAVVLSEEYDKLDGSIGERLSSLAPLAHVPRINSFIPNVSEATLDHQRLLQRLSVYGLVEVKVSGDGNCQFRALSDQIYKSPDHHKHVRKEIVNRYLLNSDFGRIRKLIDPYQYLALIGNIVLSIPWRELKDCRSLYESYVPMNYKRYYKKMSKSGEWGDHVTLQAAADKFGAKVCLLTSFRDTCFIEINPQGQVPQRALWLSFWSEVHYNSLYERREAQAQQRPRRRHWLF